MVTRKNNKKSKKIFRKTRSKRQRGGALNDNLIRAARNNRIIKVQQTLDAGAAVNAKDDQNRTALYWASMNGYTEIVAMLLENGADVNAKDNWGATALSAASNSGHTEIVEILLAQEGIDVNTKRSNGMTALIWASWKGHIEIVVMLLEKGADVNAENDYGKTALSVASDHGHPEIVKLLKQYLILPVVQKHSQRQRDRVNLGKVLQGVRGTSNRGPGGKLPTDIIRMMEGDTSATGRWSKGFLGGKRKSKRKTRKTRRK